VTLARAACVTRPLTADALRMIDVDAFCDEVDDGAILLCRSVQKRLRETLSTPAAEVTAPS
jgi:hypothetical protein